MSRLSIPRSLSASNPRKRRGQFQTVVIDPELRRGHLQIKIVYAHDGYYDLLINERPASLITFEGRLHWDDSGGNLVTDIDTLLSLRRQMGLAWFCLKRNFSEILNGAGVAA